MNEELRGLLERYFGAVCNFRGWATCENRETLLQAEKAIEAYCERVRELAYSKGWNEGYAKGAFK